MEAAEIRDPKSCSRDEWRGK